MHFFNIHSGYAHADRSRILRVGYAQGVLGRRTGRGDRRRILRHRGRRLLAARVARSQETEQDEEAEKHWFHCVLLSVARTSSIPETESSICRAGDQT